jgi:hypothetical protein
MDADPPSDDHNNHDQHITVTTTLVAETNDRADHEEDDDDDDEEDDETDSEPDDDDENDSQLQQLPTPSGFLSRPPKMRLKLSMRKLPTLANRNPSSQAAPRGSDEEDEEHDDVKAMVVDSDDAGDDPDVVAAVVDDDPSSQNTAPTTNNKLPNNKQRRSLNHSSRQIRLPPIASPGLYMLPPSVAPKHKIAKNGLVAPSDVFDYNMEQAGYSIENRTLRPHRGSSVTRTVGDMFDSNIVLSLRFPPLIPAEPKEERQDDDEDDNDMEIEKKSLRQQLMNALAKKEESLSSVTEKVATNNHVKLNTSAIRKRKKPSCITDMVPVSLTVQYPEEYIQKQLQYVQDVKARERAIIEYQDAKFALDLATSEEEPDDSNNNNHSNDKDERSPRSLPIIPPIPRPPTPPALKDVGGILAEMYDEVDVSIYLPKGKADYVAHLDTNAFHITDGRYFGLESNFVADPNFVGPNAPGINGVNASGGSGLATSSSGSGFSGAMALTLSTTYNGTTAGTAAALRSAMPPPSSFSSSSYNNTTGSTSTVPVVKSASDTNSASITPPHKKDSTGQGKTSSPTDSQNFMGPRPTATFSELKKVFEHDGQLGKSMKECIIKAAVHACRSGRHGVSWLAPNGETFPDVSKAFAIYAGIKPCLRCKNNKQGSYHCRLRRQHKDLDHDGGDSPALLAPLLNAPMESLIPTTPSG